MRAVEATTHGEADVLTTTTRLEPSPGADEVRIDVAAAGVNFAAVDRLQSLLTAGDVAVRTDRTVPFDEATAAHEHVQARGTRGKVLLEP